MQVNTGPCKVFLLKLLLKWSQKSEESLKDGKHSRTNEHQKTQVGHYATFLNQNCTYDWNDQLNISILWFELI